MVVGGKQSTGVEGETPKPRVVTLDIRGEPCRDILDVRTAAVIVNGVSGDVALIIICDSILWGVTGHASIEAATVHMRIIDGLPFLLLG